MIFFNFTPFNYQGLPGLNGEFVKGRTGPMGEKGEAGIPLSGFRGGKGEQGPQGQVGPDADQKRKHHFLEKWF